MILVILLAHPPVASMMSLRIVFQGNMDVKTFLYFSNASDLGSQVNSSNDMLDYSIETSFLDCLSPTVEQVLLTLQSAGWDLSILKDSATIITDTDTSKIAHTGNGAGLSWDLNYLALASLMIVQYYLEYHAIFGMIDIPVMSEATWNKTIGWLGKMLMKLLEWHVNRCAKK